MLDASFADAIPAGPEDGATFNADTRQSNREPNASRTFQSRGDASFVHERLAWIAALADRGSSAEARGACADLLFDFQPLVVAHPDLVALCDDVLRRCGATALRFRFFLAVHGDASDKRVSVTPDRRARRTSETV
jgi:hypothetical protein